MEGIVPTSQLMKQRLSHEKMTTSSSNTTSKPSHAHPQVGAVILYGVPIVSLVIESQERLCLAQISNTLLKQFSYNEIHNRRVALGITCVQCTPVQLEILRRAGAMPVSSRRCGMITRREAERLCKSFLGDNAPPRLPDDFAFSVHHECAWGCRGAFLPARYNSSRAKCIKCTYCGLFFSPNKFIFHSHRTSPNATYVQPDAANFNSWRRHMKLSGSPPENIVYAWEDVKAMFNGGTRKRMLSSSGQHHSVTAATPTSKPRTPSPAPAKQMKMDSPPETPVPYPPPTPTPANLPLPHRVPPFPDFPIPMSVMDYVWNGMDGIKPPFLSPYLPWFGSTKRSVLGFSNLPPLSSSQDNVLQDPEEISESENPAILHSKLMQNSVQIDVQTDETSLEQQLLALIEQPPDVLITSTKNKMHKEQMSQFPNHGKFYHQSAFRPVYPAIGNPDYENPKPEPKKSLNISPKSDEDLEEASTNYPLKKEADESSIDSSDSRDDEREVYSRLSKNNETLTPDDNHDEDETVDIETTDDLTEGERNRVHGAGDKKSQSPEPSHHRIWTIARFSLEEPNRYKPVYSPNKFNDDEDGSREAVVMNLATADNSNSQKLDCLTCCPQPLGQL